jgi:hypothetical protein
VCDRSARVAIAVALAACAADPNAGVDARVVNEDARGADTGCVSPPMPLGLAQPCLCDSDCRTELTCVVDGISHDHVCGVACSSGNDCPMDFACVGGACSRTCTMAGQCGHREHCLDDGTQMNRGTCIPFCTSAADCPGMFCSPYTGMCVASSTPPPGGDTDTACTADTDCRSMGCGADHRCGTTCIYTQGTHGTCPSGEGCLVVMPNPPDNEFGICVQLCTMTSDCRNPAEHCIVPAPPEVGFSFCI